MAEDITEMLGQNQNLQFLRENCCSIGAGQSTGSIRVLAPRFLKGAERGCSLRFGPRTSDLLGLPSHPDVLHLPQSFLQKTGKPEESHFVIIGQAVDVCFVQSILLGNKGADIRVVVIKSVHIAVGTPSWR
ncbi:unnamed protein product [Dibothriocephalus latus]|uniref:Uncharacterized protein n=1 Tax=Dibothriocephalus latus TaxID=60516 RepID=A0A3P7PPL8_DIBLA|nr:unnamed protein product [Dibothriocephalus latus]